MKRLSTALLGVGLLALAACGSTATNNTSANDAVSNDVYDVPPDSLNALDNETGNLTDSNESSNASNGL